jgi:hypothetical protein
MAANVVLDLLCLLAVLGILKRMTGSRHTLSFAARTVVMVATAALFGGTALICSAYFVGGMTWAYLRVNAEFHFECRNHRRTGRGAASMITTVPSAGSEAKCSSASRTRLASQAAV